jgi:hypothetical protein
MSVRAPLITNCVLVTPCSRPSGPQHRYKRWPPKNHCIFTPNGLIHAALLTFSVTCLNWCPTSPILMESAVLFVSQNRSFFVAMVLYTAKSSSCHYSCYNILNVWFSWTVYDFLEQCNFFLCMVHGMFMLLVFSSYSLVRSSFWFGSIRIHIGGCTSKTGFSDRLTVSPLAHVMLIFSLPLIH